MNWDNIFNALGEPESFLSIIFLILAFILGMMFTWIWRGGRIKDAEKALEAEQMKSSGLMGKNAELESETKIHLADVNRIKIQNRETVNQNETLLQEKDQLYSQVMMLSESETLLKDELDDLNSRYAVMETSHQKMNSSLMDVSSDFELSVAQKDSLNSRIAELEAMNQNLLEIRINENASYRAQLGALQETLNHLTAEHTVAQNDLAAKTEGLDDFKSKYLSLKNEHGALASSHENMVADLGEKTTKLEKQQDTINALLVKQNEYIVNLEAAKEDVNSFNSAASNSKDKEIAKVYNAQILSLQEALESATNNLATLEAEKANTNEELEQLRASVNSSDDSNGDLSYSSFDDVNETSLAVELNVVKKRLGEEQEARIEQQQEADRWRASLITLKANLGQAEEDRAKEQENFLNELAELKASHREVIALETQKLLEANTKVDELEAKISLLASTDNDENGIVHLETSQSNVPDIDNEQENPIDGFEAQNVQLDAAADEVASQNMQALEEEHEKAMATANEQIDALNIEVDKAEAKVASLEAALNDAENHTIELEEKYAKILSIEGEKFSAAKDNIMNLETQVSLLEAKAIRLEATANDAENDYIEHEAKFVRLIDLEQVKLSTVKDANMALMEQIAEFKMKAAGSIPDTGDRIVQSASSTVDTDTDTNTRTDANLTDDSMDRNQSAKALKKLIGTAIPAASNPSDNLQEINGIGPLLEGGLNQLGINSYAQISALTDTHIPTLRRALDIFPGRIEQDDWVGQAKKMVKSGGELTPENAKLAIQDLIGNKIPMALAKDKDDLKLVKGIGGFLEKKLNGIGIYTFKQISTFDKDTIEKVTVAIEFFPGRISRDRWVKQAKELM